MLGDNNQNLTSDQLDSLCAKVAQLLNQPDPIQLVLRRSVLDEYYVSPTYDEPDDTHWFSRFVTTWKVECFVEQLSHDTVQLCSATHSCTVSVNYKHGKIAAQFGGNGVSTSLFLMGDHWYTRGEFQERKRTEDSNAQ